LSPIPKNVHQLKMRKREGGEGTRLWVDSLAGLLGLVEIDTVELDPWNATVDDIDLTDRVVIDLDPGEGVAQSAARRGHRELAEADRQQGRPRG
jgi:bifunctional non-homologous end joining protein LigD